MVALLARVNRHFQTVAGNAKWMREPKVKERLAKLLAERSAAREAAKAKEAPSAQQQQQPPPQPAAE
jgi:hypothetical protein